MHITHVHTHLLLGRTVDLAIEAPYVLLTGGIGAGKSSVIHGIHFALGLPTPFGERGLERLSPTGSWRCGVELDNEEVRSLQRICEAGRTTLQVNGLKATKTQFAAATKAVLDVEDHHVDLGRFLELSGEKRAALFSGMLESSSRADLNAVLDGGLEAWLTAEAGDAAKDVLPLCLPRLRGLLGTPSELAKGVREVSGEAQAAHRDARTRLEGLIERQAHIHGTGRTPEELRGAIKPIDEALGALKDRKADLERQREQYEAASKVLAKAREDEAAAAKKVADLRAIEGELQKRRDSVAAAEASLTVATEAAEPLPGRADAARAAVESLDMEIGGLERAKGLVVDLLSQEWSVDHEWLESEVEELLSPMGGCEPVFPLVPGEHERFVDFAREVVCEVMGGTPEKIDARLESLRDKRGDAESAHRAAKKAAAEAAEKVTALTKAREEAQERLRSDEEAVEGVPAAEEARDAAITRRAELEQSTQQAAVQSDEAAIDAEIETKTAERETLAAELRKLEEDLTLSGQVENQRVEVAVRHEALEVLKRLTAVVQEWRDTGLRDQMAKVMGPFADAFSAVWGDGMEIGHSIEGAGRSTSFDITVSRHGHQVPLDLLSDGETVLTAAAFLAALQSVKEGPGSFLSLNSEALDAAGLRRLVAAVPKLGLDFAVVANNRGQELTEADRPGWQVIDLEAL